MKSSVSVIQELPSLLPFSMMIFFRPAFATILQKDHIIYGINTLSRMLPTRLFLVDEQSYIEYSDVTTVLQYTLIE